MTLTTKIEIFGTSKSAKNYAYKNSEKRSIIRLVVSAMFFFFALIGNWFRLMEVKYKIVGIIVE